MIAATLASLYAQILTSMMALFVKVIGRVTIRENPNEDSASDESISHVKEDVELRDLHWECVSIINGTSRNSSHYLRHVEKSSLSKLEQQT